MSLSNSSTASQNAAILSALRAGKRISPMDALHDFGCWRLAARIYELRSLGHHIVTHWDSNNDKRWAVYRLLKEAR